MLLLMVIVESVLDLLNFNLLKVIGCDPRILEFCEPKNSTSAEAGLNPLIVSLIKFLTTLML